MLPSTVAPIIGPRSTPSLTVMRPGARVAELDVAVLDVVGSIRHDAVEGAVAANREGADIDDALLRRAVLCRRIHADPHLAADHALIKVGEAKQRAGVVGLEIEHRLAVVGTRANLSNQRRIAADLGIEREGANL